MFIDNIKISAKAGNGGNGCVSFHKEKFKPKGGPDGGNGGKGGDIILQTDHHVDNLNALFYQPILKAKNGKNGSGNNRTGKNGKSLVIKIPAGTIVKKIIGKDEKLNSENSNEKNPILADLTESGQKFILAKGGKGGKGNTNFKSSTNQAPRNFTPGEPGEEGNFSLELRKIANVGLVGFPNAGKSTLISAMSSARPKVAGYPFTTLTPHIGIIQLKDYRRISMADIPGIIEGAHSNRGLGHKFLRHIMRCQVLVFVVDISGMENRNPIDDIQTLRKELKLYNPELPKKKWLIVANKIDLPPAEENLAHLRSRFKRVKIFPISAKENRGLEALKDYFNEITEFTKADL